MTRRVLRRATILLVVCVAWSMHGATLALALSNPSPPPPPPVQGPPPSTTANTVVQNGQLQSTVSGFYAPVYSGGTNPLTGKLIPPPAPAGGGPIICPPASSVTGINQSSPNEVDWLFSIYPAVTANSDGSYTLSDAGYHYSRTIPAGGPAGSNSPGSDATASNIAGHGVAVTGATSQGGGTWDPATGCTAVVVWSNPIITAPLPPPSPSSTTLGTAPFGAVDILGLTSGWNVGSIAALPTIPTTTFVNIPTCAWLQGSAVPTTPVIQYAYSAVPVATQFGTLTVFLRYEVTVTPSNISWDFGDGDATPNDRNNGPQISSGSYSGTPPTYSEVSQTWNTSPCTVYHYYRAVAGARTITATEPVDVHVTVSWDDGFTIRGPVLVACPGAANAPATTPAGDCGVTLQWTSAPRSVEQIEAVPFVP